MTSLDQLDPCLRHRFGDRRVFWTTQPDACGNATSCGRDCLLAGLKYEEAEGGRTIMTADWLRGLILNILNTRARSDAPCPTPTAVYGHWSESYRDDGLHIGTRLWNMASKPYMRIGDAVRAVQAAVQSDLGKLVTLGLATGVDVKAHYSGNNQVNVEIVTTTSTGSSRIGLAGAFVTGNWVWR